MPEFKCSECGKDLKDGDVCQIITVGKVVESCGSRYMTERRVYVCEDCK